MLDFNPIDLKAFLDEKYDLYNRESFIKSDPIQIPHLFSKKEDIEIAAFLSATIAWGQRGTIIRNAKWLMEKMEYQPYDYLLHANDEELKIFKQFKHRTFNGEDCDFFLRSLRNIYLHKGGLESVFTSSYKEKGNIKEVLCDFRTLFFEVEHLRRSEKHVSNVEKKSAAKRLNMFLRWMVRKDNRGVDFGIWEGISPVDLYLPLDVHTGNVGRKLNLLHRKQNDWIAVEEITQNLRKLDPNDPVKYDYALFGLGAFEKF